MLTVFTKKKESRKNTVFQRHAPSRPSIRNDRFESCKMVMVFDEIQYESRCRCRRRCRHRRHQLYRHIHCACQLLGVLPCTGTLKPHLHIVVSIKIHVSLNRFHNLKQKVDFMF